MIIRDPERTRAAKGYSPRIDQIRICHIRNAWQVGHEIMNGVSVLGITKAGHPAKKQQNQDVVKSVSMPKALLAL